MTRHLVVLFVKYAIELYRCVDYTADTAAFVDDNNNDDGQMIRRGSQQYYYRGREVGVHG